MHSIPKAARPVIEKFAPAFTRPTLVRFAFLLFAAILNHGAAHRNQHFADSGPRYARPSFQLSPRVLVPSLVQLEIGSRPGNAHSRPLASPGAGASGRRRYGGRASRQEGLREGVSPRRCALDAFLHRVSLGTQVGCVGNLGEVSLCRTTVGVARPGGVVSQPGMEQKAQAATQNPGGTHATTAGRACALVSPAKIRVCRRWRLRNPSAGKLCASTSKATGFGQSPVEVVAKSRRRRLNVAWYGGGRRDVAVVTATGHWYKGGEGLVPVRWVFVHDCTGTHREEYFFTTDLGMTPQQIIEAYTGRWSIETTFHRRCAPTWAWKRPAAERRTRCCGWPHVSSGCIR